MKRIIACALLLPAAGLAQESSQISYDYFDFDYFRTDWDAGAIETDGAGWGGRFSVGIRERVYITGGYQSWEPDGVSGGSTFKKLGFGLHGDIGQRWSLYGEAGFKSIDIDLGGPSPLSNNVEDDPGYFGAGARWYVADGYELRVGAEFSEDRAGSLPGAGESTVFVGGDVYLTDAAALTVEMSENDDNTTTFLIGLRFYHKKDSGGLRQRR